MSTVLVPPRGNHAGSEWTPLPAKDRRDDLGDHLIEVDHPNHTAVCIDCGYWITVGPDGREYGHARLTNSAYFENGERADCPNRPPECNPTRGGASR
jgi:hypothetical protein